MPLWNHRVVDRSAIRRILWMIAASSLLLIVVATVLIYQFTVGPNAGAQGTDGPAPATSPADTTEPSSTQPADSSDHPEILYTYRLYTRSGDRWEPLRTITAASHADALRDAAQSLGDEYRGKQIRLEQDPPPAAPTPTTRPAAPAESPVLLSPVGPSSMGTV